MNHTYKTLYNTALGAWVAVPETARNHGKTKSVKVAAVAIAVGRRIIFFSCAGSRTAVGKRCQCSGQ